MLLRLCIIEKHTALRYIAEGHGIKGFEAPGYTEAVKEVKGESEGEREREKEVEVPLSGRTEGDEKARRGEKDVEKNVAASGEGGWMSKIPEEFLVRPFSSPLPHVLRPLTLKRLAGLLGSLPLPSRHDRRLPLVHERLRGRLVARYGHDDLPRGGVRAEQFGSGIGVLGCCGTVRSTVPGSRVLVRRLPLYPECGD